MMKLTKWSLIFSTAFGVMGVQAAPRMDTAVGTSTPLLATVLPDDEVQNLYYVFPQTSVVALKADGKQDFLYLETRTSGRRGRYRVDSAKVSAWVVPSIQSQAMDRKIQEIQSMNPRAKFAVVTAFKTEIITKNETGTYFLDSNCPGVNGPLEVPVYCEIEINPRMATAFHRLLSLTEIRVFQLVYHFYGSENGEIKEYVYSVPIKIGSLNGGDYFFDQWGNRI